MFRPRRPWWGGDLQTLRDSLRPQRLPPEQGQPHPLPLPGGEALLAFLDLPTRSPLGLVVVVHGLGGGSEGRGPRRLAWTLRHLGFATLRLNLRGAGAGRPLAGGSYAARCDRDLLPALDAARTLAIELARVAGRADPLPLLAAGLSLGGTVLLNACLADRRTGGDPLAGLVCISSPLDLAACTAAIERPRNGLYQAWLLRRLRRQVLADPSGLGPGEAALLAGRHRPRSIRAFDAAITAPRWGYACVEDYYASASPLPRLLAGEPLPPTLLLQAADDPWVPVTSLQPLITWLQTRDPDGSAARSAPLELEITASGGHNGFHSREDRQAGLPGSWADQRCALWLRSRLPSQPGPP